MPDKIVNHFVLADGSTAKYSATQLAGDIPEVVDIRTGYDGTVYQSAGDAVRGQTDTVINLIDSISHVFTSENIYNEEEAKSGYYVDNTTGKLEQNSDVSYFDYMDCSKYDNLIISRSIENLSGKNFRFAFYDDRKVFINGGTGGSLTENYDSDLLRYWYIIPTNGAKYFRCSYNTVEIITNRKMCIGNSILYVPYINKRVANGTENIDAIQSSVICSAPPIEYLATMENGGAISLPENNVRTKNSIVFYAKINSFNRIDIGHYNASEKGIRLAISNTGIVWFTDGTASSPIAHGLTFKNYIYIRIDIDNSQNYKITIRTNGGQYSRTEQYWSGWYGSVQVNSVGTSLYDCYLSNELNIASKVWLFGDSYMSNNTSRWVYYAFEDNYNDILINAYPGAGTQNIEPSFENLLDYGNPRFAIWGLGMNNADNNNLNATWQTQTEKFIEKCISRNIVPILATIPNTPTQNNLKKNAFVKKSGLRYIDFAKAVNAESSNSTWFDGMLSNDKVHPTEDGAKALYAQVLCDFPEIMTT